MIGSKIEVPGQFCEIINKNRHYTQFYLWYNSCVLHYLKISCSSDTRVVAIAASAFQIIKILTQVANLAEIQEKQIALFLTLPGTGKKPSGLGHLNSGSKINENNFLETFRIT